MTTLCYPGGKLVRLHAAYDALWKLEQGRSG